MGRHPKLKLYHSSSKRSDIAVTSPTRRQACCWIPRKLQITQSSRTQPAQNLLPEIFRRTFAVVTEPSQWNQSAAYTFCTTITYFFTCQSLHLHTQSFQPHSPHFLKGTPLQWTRKERKVVFPHYKTLFIRKSFVCQARCKVTQAFLPENKIPVGELANRCEKYRIEDFALEILQDSYKNIKYKPIQDMPTTLRTILKYQSDVRITNLKDYHVILHV